MSENQKVTTEADVLVSLLRDVGEIALKDAATKLGVSLDTLEAWTTFLEEEGIVTVKYRFTTPYLSLAKNADAKPTEQSAGSQSEHNEVRELLSRIAAQTKAGDFAKLPASTESLLDKLNRMLDQGKDLPKQQRTAFKSELERAQKELGSAHSLVDEGQFDEAVTAYTRLAQRLEQIATSLRSLFQRRPEEQGETAQDVNALLDKAYEQMRAGDIDAAKGIHQTLTQVYSGLSGEFDHKRRALEHNLAKLTKDLSTSVDRQSIERMQKGEQTVKQLLGVMKDALKKKNLKDAEKAYVTMRTVYSKLPTGFYAEKKALQAGIIDAYEELSAQREKIFSGSLKETAQRVDALLGQMDNAVKAGRLDDAVALYRDAKAAFGTLPTGFLTDKLSIQSRILAAYSRLMQAYERGSSQELAQDENAILKLLEQMGQAIDEKRSSEALSLYQQVRERYAQLPGGFLAEKTKLQRRILEVYEKLTTSSASATSEEVGRRIEEMKRALDEGFSYVKQGQHGLAREVYVHVVKLYRVLPPGFSQSKAMIRTRMLSLYKELAQHSDEHLRRSFSEDAHETYHTLLAQVLAVHHAVAHRDFDLLEADYHKVLRLFKQLPVGFVEQESQLSSMIETLRMESELHAKLQQLAQRAGKKNAAQLRQDIADIEKLKEQVAQRAPQDIELVNYANEMVHRYHVVGARIEQKGAAPAVPLDFEKTRLQPPAKKQQAAPRQLPEQDDVRHELETDDFDALEQKIAHLSSQARAQVKLPQ